jgi:hypothetical protein
MKVTRKTVADKLAVYLHGSLSQSELVNWAENTMMETNFEERDANLLADIVGRLGLADVAEFGLRWEDCENFCANLVIARASKCRLYHEALESTIT